MKNTYPRSLAGLYHVNFTDLILKPIYLIDTVPSDHQLKEIRFESGIGNAVFENGFVYTLNVKYDEILNTYTFWYASIGCKSVEFGKRKANHSFEITASLAGVHPVDIMSLVDFGGLAKAERLLNEFRNCPFGIQ